jgi:diaminopimelate epimerase
MPVILEINGGANKMCMILKIYDLMGIEYMVYDVQKNKMEFDAEQIELLCNRRNGVGADRFVMIMGNMQQRISFCVWDEAGRSVEISDKDKIFFACYLKDHSYTKDQTEIVGTLGDKAILDSQMPAEKALVTEVRLTDAFVQRMEQKDKKQEEFAC